MHVPGGTGLEVCGPVGALYVFRTNTRFSYQYNKKDPGQN